MQKSIYTGATPIREISDAFCETLEELFLSDDKVVYIDADLMASMKTSTLWNKYPKQVFNAGIQEANMVGVASGMYLSGLKPYIHSFAPFISRRVFDQVFISIAYANKSIRLIGSDAGITATYNGGTHMCFEDIAMMRTVPGACIVDVSDAEMLSYLLKETKDRAGLTYFRTARRGVSDIYPKGTTFEVGKSKILSSGKDVSIIASGIMVATALEAAKLLEDEGIQSQVIDIITIKPLDTEIVSQCALQTGAIVTAENGSVNGGLGSAISEYLSETNPVPVMKIGIQDVFGQVGSETFLREIYGLRAEDIANKAKLAIELKNRRK